MSSRLNRDKLHVRQTRKVFLIFVDWCSNVCAPNYCEYMKDSTVFEKMKPLMLATVTSAFVKNYT